MVKKINDRNAPEACGNWTGEIDGISGADATLRAGALYLCMT